MKIRFTKASKRDNTLVTVSLTALAKSARAFRPADNKWGPVTNLPRGSRFSIKVDGVDTVFVVNRVGKTAATKGFPRHLRLPSLSRAVNAEVNRLAVAF
jgi:hypothetical protein